MKMVDIIKTPRPKPTLKSIGWLLVKIYLGIFLLLILVWGINLSLHAVHLYTLAKNVQANQTQIQPDTILSTLEEAANDVSTIHQLLHPLYPIFKALHGLPGAGLYLGQVEPLVMYADGLAQAGKEIASGLEPLLVEAPSGQANLSLPERASQATQSGQANFLNAAKSIDQANQARSLIRPELMPGSIQALFLKLDGNFALLEAGVQVLRAAPMLLGANQAQNYLVLAQNRDELRASGGFISGIGLLIIKNGKILQFDLGDSYAIDDFSKAYPTPPEPLKRLMLADYWVTRDANWSPDFPSAALEAQTLYTLSTGIQTQGVIAFNQIAIQRILEVVGPVVVPGTNEPVTATNVEAYMRQAWASAPDEGLSEEWWLHRKDFMQLLGNVILDKAINSSNQEQLLKMAVTMTELLDQGQLLIYFNNPIAQAALMKGGWDGGLHPGNNDYLYLVDSNVGFNKVDSVIQRSLTYQVDLRDLTHPIGEVTLTYQHTGSGEQVCKQMISYGNGTYQDMQQRCYLDYWRVYIPGGSGLMASTAQPVPVDTLLNGLGWSGQVETMIGEAGTQVFAGLLMLSSNKSSNITVTYSLPPGVVRPESSNILRYILRVRVQPGLNGLPFRLEIKLPASTSVPNPGVGWQSLDPNSWIWEGLLDKPIELSLSIQAGPKP